MASSIDDEVPSDLMKGRLLSLRCTDAPRAWSTARAIADNQNYLGLLAIRVEV